MANLKFYLWLQSIETLICTFITCNTSISWPESTCTYCWFYCYFEDFMTIRHGPNLRYRRRTGPEGSNPDVAPWVIPNPGLKRWLSILSGQWKKASFSLSNTANYFHLVTFGASWVQQSLPPWFVPHIPCFVCLLGLFLHFYLHKKTHYTDCHSNNRSLNALLPAEAVLWKHLICGLIKRFLGLELG